MFQNETTNKLIELGYHYNAKGDYLFKTIEIHRGGSHKTWKETDRATCFYENGEFEFTGFDYLINELKEELRKGEILE